MRVWPHTNKKKKKKKQKKQKKKHENHALKKQTLGALRLKKKNLAPTYQERHRGELTIFAKEVRRGQKAINRSPPQHPSTHQVTPNATQKKNMESDGVRVKIPSTNCVHHQPTSLRRTAPGVPNNANTGDLKEPTRDTNPTRNAAIQTIANRGRDETDTSH